MARDLYLDEWKDKITLIQAWARDGLTNEQIAQKMGVTRQTLHNYTSKYPELKQAIKKGKEVVDVEVENSLLKRALGYQYTEETIERIFNKETKEHEMVVTKTVTKEMPPDTTAQIFWLKNRKSFQWRDRKNIEASLRSQNKNINLDKLTDKQIDKILREEVWGKNKNK